MRISDWSSDVCSSDLLFEQVLVDLDLGAPFGLGGELGHQLVAEGRPKRLRDRSDACRLDILGAGAVDLAERDHHPAAIAGDFERLDAVLRHREEQCEFGRNRLAVLAEFGATAADRLDIADVRPGLARRGGQILAALDRLDARACLVARYLLPPGQAPAPGRAAG